MKETGQPPVNACLVSKETPMLNVSLSAPSTRSAPQTWHAFSKSVRILVLESVAPTQDVQFKTTIRAVLVTQDTPETPSDSAPESQLCQFLQKSSTPASRLLVDQMLSVMRGTGLQLVSVSQTTLETLTLPVDQNVW